MDVNTLETSFAEDVDFIDVRKMRVAMRVAARKIAGTLTSTGTPATYLHPVEGLHGDMGIVGRQDVAILVSKSGDTSESGGLIDYLLRLGVPIIALSGRIG